MDIHCIVKKEIEYCGLHIASMPFETYLLNCYFSIPYSTVIG